VSSRYFMLNRQIFLLLSAIVFTIVSCNQGMNYNVLPQKADNNQDNLILVELKQSESYKYKTGISGDEEGVLIKGKPNIIKLAKLSEIQPQTGKPYIAIKQRRITWGLTK